MTDNDVTDAPWAGRLAVFDLETTGVNPAEARIVTAFVGELDLDGNVTHRRSWVVNPGIDIPAAAADVHGYTTERAAAEGMEPREAITQIHALITRLLAASVPIAAFNAAYDFTVLDREARRHGLPDVTVPKPVIDPLILDKHIDQYRRGKRTLGATCAHYGVVLDDWHDAAADAIACGRLAQAIGRVSETVRVPAWQLHEAQEGWASEQAESFAKYMRSGPKPDFVADSGWPVRD